MHFTRNNNALIRYFLIPKSRDLVSHNPGISGLKKRSGIPGFGIPGLQSLQLTRHALNIKKTWDWLLDRLYLLSKFVDNQMINDISKKYFRTHTPRVPLTYCFLLGRLMTTHVSFDVTVPSTLIVTI